MKICFFFLFILAGSGLCAQSGESVFDANKLEIVLTHPGMERVTQKKNLVYLKDKTDTLHADVYLPPDLRENEKRPAIVFLNGVGSATMKNNGVYVSWARLIASHGMIAVTMEADRRTDACFNALFAFIAKEQTLLHIDTGNIGVYASSANARAASRWIMGPQVFSGIKSAALYYAEVPTPPYRADLPVLFIAAEADMRNFGYENLWTEVLKQKSPWTITFGTGMLHGFDGLVDSDDARRLIRQTLNFWKNHFEPTPYSSGKNPQVREVLAAQYQGDHKKVIRLLNAWFEENPKIKDAPALRLLASSLMREARYAEAEVAYKKSIAIDPKNRGSLLDMVVISYALDKRAEAEKYLARYETGESPEGFTYGYVGRFLLQQGKYAAAETYFSRAIALGPHPSDYYNLARCQARKGQADAAFENLFKAVAAGFKNLQAYDAAELSGLKDDNRWQALTAGLK